MDYYNILGLQRGASADEIKKAFRKAAMKHHPDRGGDEVQFKKINEAYEILSDPQKKQMVDMGVDPLKQNQGGGGPGFQEFHFHTGNSPFGFGHPFNDIFTHFGFGAQHQQQARRKNSNVAITVELSLLDVIKGKDLEAELTIGQGQKKLIKINIPAGVEEGQQIKYTGMGDTSIAGLPAGDLIVNIRIRPDDFFMREGDNLVCEYKIPVWDAILGTGIQITTAERKELTIGIPAGTQPDTVLNCSGEGLPNVRTGRRGNLYIKVKVAVPRNITPEQKELIEQIKNAI